MRAIINIIPIYLIIFLLYGRKDIKGFLLITGIFSLPLRIDFALVGGLGSAGWTNGIIIRLSDISFIFLVIYLIFTKEQGSKVPFRKILPVLLFIGACILSSINSTARKSTFYQIVMVSQITFLYYISLIKSIKSEKDIKDLIIFLTISLLFQSIYAIMQFISGQELDFFSTGSSSIRFYTVGGVSEARRVFGTVVGKPNAFAAYISPLLLLNISILFGTRQNRKIVILATVFGCLALAISFSRGAWVGFCLSLIIFFFIGLKEDIIHFKHIVIIIIIFIIVIVFFSNFFLSVKTRILDYQNRAALSRIPLLKVAFNMIKDHPIIGIGANTYNYVVKSYIRGIYLSYIDQVHNQYLLVFAETGILGLASFLWLLVSFYRESFRCYRQNKNNIIRYLGLGIGLGFISSSIHMMVDMFNSPLLFTNLFILGSLVTASNNITEKNDTRLN